MTHTDYHSHLQNCRAFLREYDCDGFVLSVNDEFFSEYPPEHFKRLQWLTGFTGSAGVVVILAEKAAFFTDGRYTLQAADELDSGDYDVYNGSDVAPWAWLAEHASGLNIGYDSWLFSVSQLARWEQSCGTAKLGALAQNPVDALWGGERPALSGEPAFVYPLEYAGESHEKKRARIAASLHHEGADAALLSAPESVMWLLNIRGRDMDYTPILLCRALLLATGDVRLYAPVAKLPALLQASLGDHVSVVDPAHMASDMDEHLSGSKLMVNQPSLSVALAEMVDDAGAEMLLLDDPCSLPKALKNDTELQHIAQTHVTDGRALSAFLLWLENTKEPVSELSASDKLEEFRRESEAFIESSFPTISGFGPNGAIVHYRVTPETDLPLCGDSLYLVDSGGQYLGGTTDVTRTVAVGTPSDEMKQHFTRVLKGHIALANMLFPQGTTGAQLDVLARQYLWEVGLDYDHGTGHGVGCFLGVHEGPQGVSKRSSGVALQPGMVLSNEPGYYQKNDYGIRVESLVIVSEVPTLHQENPQQGALTRVGYSLHDASLATPLSTQGKRFFSFRTITCAPMDERLVVWDMLSEVERQWLRGYHAWVEAQLTLA